MNVPKNVIPLFALFPTHAAAELTVYFDEARYIEALTTNGYSVLHEGFEDEQVWAPSRTSIQDPGSTGEVTSQGIVWRSNFPANDISTGDLGGDTMDGVYGLFSNPHGDPDVEWRESVCDVSGVIPEQCFLRDGFTGTSESAGTLYGLGGWIDGTFGADIVLFLDGVAVNFGAAAKISGWTFFGVVDTEGFNSFEFRDVEGKGGQAIYIFGDDFDIGVNGGGAAAWDYCLNIACPGCGSWYPSHQLRINVDPKTSTFDGLVQAQDGSASAPVNGVLRGVHAFFGVRESESKTLYIYSLDLAIPAGTLHAIRYDVDDQVPGSLFDRVTETLTVAPCPIP